MVAAVCELPHALRLLDIDPEGVVVKVVVPQAIGYGLDDWCRQQWRKAKFKPGLQNGEPVGVTGIPMKCVVKATE